MNNFDIPKPGDVANIYDSEKYSQILEPRSEIERKLWSQLEKADRPIINILKRINFLSLDRFPNDGFITSDSCSGHITQGYKFEKEPHIFFSIKPAYKTVEENGEEYDEIEDFDEESAEKFINFFEKIFLSSINEVNEKYSQEVIVFGYFDYRDDKEGQFINKEYINKEPVLSFDAKAEEVFYVYNIGYFFNIKNAKDGKVLQDFWGSVENNLSQIDGIKYKTKFNNIDFIEK